MSIDDVDIVAYGYDPVKKIRATLNDKETLRHNGQSFFVNLFNYAIPSLEQPRIAYYLKKRLNGKKEPEIEFVDHHLSHAASSYLLSGFDNSLIFVNDGSGEEDCISAYVTDGNEMIKLFSVPRRNSIGVTYQRGTKLLGFKGYQDEYKVMGLSPYGKPTYLEHLKSQVKEKDGILEMQDGLQSVHNIEKLTGVRRRQKGEPLEENHKNFASSLQKFTEYAIAHYIARLKDEYPSSDNLCMAGGVALNCVMNEKIRKQFKNIFIQPAAGDAGTAVGSALYLASKYDNKFENRRLNDHFLGPGYSEKTIKKLLDVARIKYRKMKKPQLYHEVAKQLAEGKILAIFQGRMEYGPRSLGNRSIVADPTKKDMRDRINSAIKFREGFRPFAPSVMKEHYSDYFEGDPGGREYMQFVCNVKPDKRKDIPAVVHVDGTARVQTVDEKFNKDFYNYIKAFKEETGIPLLVNTSFNVNNWSSMEGKPIVMSPEQAINDFYTSGLDSLVLENFLITK